ncbi:MAG: MotA/TolQ/ExbB proton channel family protein [Kiritimatiellia bacterium]|nr:MotA/TolQ/ExbB proton channel family protein [Lentisphaerota bacterium]
MLTLMWLGGPMMWPIVFCGIMVLAVFMERALHLHRARIKTDDFLRGVANILERGNINEALSICDETPGPVAAIARAAIRHYRGEAVAVRQAIDSAALTEIDRLERRAGLLAVNAQIAPLLGLLGTMIGLMGVLIAVQQQAPLVHPGDLAGGLWQALLSSAAGLVVAVLGMVGYHMVMNKVDRLALDMEQSAGELQALVCAPPDGQPS